MIVRPRRSVLYVPASNPRAVAKSRTLDADAVVLDLEDSVAPADKPEALAAAARAVAEGGFGHREIVIRIHGLGTPRGGPATTGAPPPRPAPTPSCCPRCRAPAT